MGGHLNRVSAHSHYRVSAHSHVREVYQAAVEDDGRSWGSSSHSAR